jgi:GTP pyrophosphokinase
MRTLRYLSREKQERKSRETLEIFAPLAHRLGMNTVKWELEDLSFATMYPKRYDEIARLVAQRAPRRDVFLQEVIADLQGDLREAKIKGTVTGRPKHYYSIYQKMIARNVGFDDIYDLVGIRVLVDSVRDCYAALGTIHATSRCRSSTCTSRCTRRSSAPAASRSSCRSAPGACTSAPSTASPRTGSTRKTWSRTARP